MFDFPAAPAVDDTFTPTGGPKYVWDGISWSVVTPPAVGSTDYVLKAGDAMTGALQLPAAMPVTTTQAAHKAYVDSKGSVAEAPVDGTPYVRQDAAWVPDPVSATGAFLPLAGGVMTGGISFGARTSPGPDDVSQHLAIYDGTAKFGLSVTGGRLNYVVTDPVNSHFFRVGPNDKLQVKSDGIQVTGNVRNTEGNFISNTGGFFCGDTWHGMIFQTNVTEFVEYHGVFKYFKRTSGTTGGELLATINQAGVSSNSINVTAPTICEAVRADATLKDFLHDNADGAQVDLGALLMHALSEIKALQSKMKIITDLT